MITTFLHGNDRNVEAGYCRTASAVAGVGDFERTFGVVGSCVNSQRDNHGVDLVVTNRLNELFHCSHPSPITLTFGKRDVAVGTFPVA